MQSGPIRNHLILLLDGGHTRHLCPACNDPGRLGAVLENVRATWEMRYSEDGPASDCQACREAQIRYGIRDHEG